MLLSSFNVFKCVQLQEEQEWCREKTVEILVRASYFNNRLSALVNHFQEKMDVAVTKAKNGINDNNKD